MTENLTNKTLHFELVSPERVVLSEEAVMVVIPGKMGDLGILAGHAPLSSSIRPGVVSVHLPSGTVKKIFVTDGFSDVSGESCSLLAEEAIDINDINCAETEETLKILNTDLDAAKDDTIKFENLRKQITIAQEKIFACTQHSSGSKIENPVEA